MFTFYAASALVVSKQCFKTFKHPYVLFLHHFYAEPPNELLMTSSTRHLETHVSCAVAFPGKTKAAQLEAPKGLNLRAAFHPVAYRDRFPVHEHQKSGISG